MSDLLVSKERISREVFLDLWRKEEEARSKNVDQFTLDRLREHEQNTDFKYYVAVVTESALENLILPYHMHPVQRVNPHGEPFWDVVGRYHSEIQGDQTDDCLDKLRRIREEIQVHFKEHESLLETDFRLGRVFDDRQLAMPNHYGDHGENKLYVGNFHRFIGYGLWIREFGYQPIKVIYCENNLAA